MRCFYHANSSDYVFTACSCKGLTSVNITADETSEFVRGTETSFAVVHFQELQNMIDEMDKSEYFQTLCSKSTDVPLCNGIGINKNR